MAHYRRNKLLTSEGRGREICSTRFLNGVSGEQESFTARAAGLNRLHIVHIATYISNKKNNNKTDQYQ